MSAALPPSHISPSDAIDGSARSAELVRQLTELHKAAADRQPSLSFSEGDFVSYVSARLPSALSAAELTSFVERLHAGDLYLAAACAHGHPEAMKIFDRDVLCHIPNFLARMRLPAETLNEVTQLVRTKLLASSEGEPPKITEYAGQGPIQNWVRVVATRTALNLLRGTGRVSSLEEGNAIVEAVDIAEDPALNIFKIRYAAQFKEALYAAFGELKNDQRNLLQMYYVGGLSTTKLGALFQVNHGTIVRWLAAARDQIFERTKEILRAQLNLNSADFDSLLRLVYSQLDLSISRLLKETPPK